MRDDRLGLSWAAPAAEISLRRDVAGLAGDISLAFAASGDPASLDVAFLFDKSDGVVDFAARFSDISLATLGTAVPELAPVRGVTSRNSGSVRSEEHTAELQTIMRTSYAVCVLHTKHRNIDTHLI